MTRSTKPFVPCRLKGRTMYVGVLSIAELRGKTFVDRYNPDLPVDHPEQGYQRTLTDKRIKEVAKYLIKNDDATFASLVYNCREGLDIDENGYIKLTPEMLSSLDGQHREAGSLKAGDTDPSYNDNEVPVIIFDGLPVHAEQKVFYDLNKYQKGVPVALCKQILTNYNISKSMNDLSMEEKANRINCEVYRIMNADNNSVWFNKLYEPNARVIPKQLTNRKLTDRDRNNKLLSLGIWLETLQRVYSSLYENNIKDLEADVQVQYMVNILNNFWNAVEAVSDANIFLEPFQYCIMASKGVRLLHTTLVKTMIYLADEGEDFTQENFENVLETIDWFNNPLAWMNTREHKGELQMAGTRGTYQTALFLKGSVLEYLAPRLEIAA